MYDFCGLYLLSKICAVMPELQKRVTGSVLGRRRSPHTVKDFLLCKHEFVTSAPVMVYSLLTLPICK